MKQSEIIAVPITDYSSHTGNLLSGVFSLMEGMAYPSDSFQWDMRNMSTIHPFIMAYLAFFRINSGCSIELINLSDELSSFFESVRFDSPLNFHGELDAASLLNEYNGRGLLPLCLFDHNYPHTDKMESSLKAILSANLSDFPHRFQFREAVSYFISEMIDNIHEHSNASHGFLYLDHSDGKHLYLCIADNGITIPGNFLTQNLPEFKRFKSEYSSEALKSSIYGLSTKSQRERGYGLSTNMKMITSGLNGEFIVLSGNGLYYRVEERENLINLPHNITWDGTFIYVKIPLKIDKDFNYINFLE